SASVVRTSISFIVSPVPPRSPAWGSRQHANIPCEPVAHTEYRWTLSALLQHLAGLEHAIDADEDRDAPVVGVLVQLRLNRFRPHLLAHVARGQHLRRAVEAPEAHLALPIAVQHGHVGVPL